MKKWIFGAVLVLVLLISSGLYIYNKSMNGLDEGKDKAMKTAQEKAKLVSITGTDYYHGYKEKLSYNLVEGTDETGEQWLVLVPEENDRVLTIKQKETISAEQALQSIENNSEVIGSDEKPKEIVKMKIGAEGNVSFWEITYVDMKNRYSFCYVDLLNGRVLRLYTL